MGRKGGILCADFARGAAKGGGAEGEKGDGGEGGRRGKGTKGWRGWGRDLDGAMTYFVDVSLLSRSET